MYVSSIPVGPLKAFDDNGRAVIFKPVGKIREIGDASTWYTKDYKNNPVKRRSREVSQGGRIIVGFNVGIEERFNLDFIIDLVYRLRRAQVEAAIKDGDAKPHPLGGDIGATFIAQKGLWQPVRDKDPYPENGAQVVIMNIIEENKKRFEDDILEIGDAMIERMGQDAVIVEFSENGVVVETALLGPE